MIKASKKGLTEMLVLEIFKFSNFQILTLIGSNFFKPSVGSRKQK